ncbi:hypothetical protein SDC9_158544 [bioreactor metagenome]|uniref:Uncharacterized protein n=1 Tax=bioreactor metagenome TaxID=1076179 RepID=A0A645FFV2_9ZZZZ
MIIAARVSISIPTNRRNTLINKRTTILLSEIPKIKVAIFVGTCSIVSSLPKAVAQATKIITVPDVSAVLAKIFGKSLNLSSLYTKMLTNIA